MTIVRFPVVSITMMIIRLLVVSVTMVMPWRSEHGTAVSVQCEGNLELLGSEVVYCKEGINYLYSYRPSCVDPGKYRSNRLHVTLPVVLTAVNFTSIFKD